MPLKVEVSLACSPELEVGRIGLQMILGAHIP
jgi:hypothetical protein